MNGVPSGVGTTVDVTVGGGSGFQFVPDMVNISVGDTVRWTWANSGHSVSSGPHCVPDSQFCSPNDTSCFPGTLPMPALFISTHLTRLVVIPISASHTALLA